MQRIELADGSIAEFPDYLSDDEIESILQKDSESPGRKPIESEQSTWDSLARPFKAQTFKTAEALNRGIGSFSQNLHELSEYVGTKIGMEPGGAFERGAQTYVENAEYWRKKAEETNPGFVDEMIGEAIGGAVPGIAEFMLNVPYAAITAAKEAAKRGDSETFGAILGGAKRYVLGRIFHALGVLPKPVAAPAMGGVFATEAATSGGTPEEVAKSFGTGLLYGLSQKGRPRLRKAPKRIKEEAKIEERAREEEIIDLTERIEEAPIDLTEVLKTKLRKDELIYPYVRVPKEGIFYKTKKGLVKKGAKEPIREPAFEKPRMPEEELARLEELEAPEARLEALKEVPPEVKLRERIERKEKAPKKPKKAPEIEAKPEKAKIPSFTNLAKTKGTDPTGEAVRWGEAATPEQIKLAKAKRAELKQKVERIRKEANELPRGPKKAEKLEQAGPIAFEAQFIREAIEASEGRHPTQVKLKVIISEPKTPKVFEAVAVRSKDGTVYEGKPGEIHTDIVDRMPPDKLGPGGEFGFTDSKGKFYTRTEASKAVGEIAVSSKTLIEEKAKIAKAKPKAVGKPTPKKSEVVVVGKKQPKADDLIKTLAGFLRKDIQFKTRTEAGKTQILHKGEVLAEIKGRVTDTKAVQLIGKKAADLLKAEGRTLEKDINKMSLDEFTLAYELGDIIPEFEITGAEIGTVVKAGKKGLLEVDIKELYNKIQKQEEVAKKPPPETLETFPGFQKIYDAATKGREEKVRAAVESIRKEYLTPVEGNPLDKGAVEFLKSEKYKDYIKEMPGIGELSPKEIFKYDPEAKKLIATIETKDGKLKPAIRQSGYHALKEFADSFEGAKDISKLSPSWTDPTRMIQEIDQGKWGGMAQKHILWPSRMTTLSKLRWQDLRKAELDALSERHNIKSGKRARAVGDVIEHIGTKDVRKSTNELLQRPKIDSFLKKFKPKAKTQIVEAAKELRLFWNNLLVAQNIPRRIRKQKEIPKRASYRPWIMETNLWSKLLGQKIRPEEIMEKPTMPDFIFPNQPFNPRAEARTGLMAKYPKERNIIRLMTDYIDTAGKDIFDTNIVHNNKIHAAVLRSKGLENAAEGINRVTAEVFAGVDPRLTRWAKETVPPKARKGILAIRRNLTRAVFPLNWTWNMFIQTSSAGITYARYGNKANVAGLKYFLSPTMRRSVKQNAYSYILKSRWGGKAHYQDIQKSISRNKRLEAKPIEKVEDFLNYMTSAFEDGLTGHAVASAYHEGKTKFKLKGRELWEYASEGGAKTQSMYNYGDVPGMLRAREVGAIAPFQTFGFEVFNTIREMNVPGLRRVIGKTGLYETLSADSVAGKALMSNRLKMLARWAAAIAITDAVGEMAIGRKPWVVSSFVPFIGYLLGGYAGRGPVPHQYMQDAKKGVKDVLVYGDFKRLRKWLMRYHVLAGVQLERMVEGIEAVSQGKVTDIRGRTLFKVEPEDYLKAILMGPYRTEPGKEYIRKRRESKSLLHQLGKKKKKWRIVTKED